MQNDGKVMKKLQLSDYKWKTYQEVQSKAKSFGKGLRSLGLQSGSGVAIYAETRAEWMISCLGAFTQVIWIFNCLKWSYFDYIYLQNIHICTVYTNLGNDAVIHAINETEVQFIITSQELLPKFNELLPHLPFIKTIIYMQDAHAQSQPELNLKSIGIHTFDDLVTLGQSRPDILPNEPKSTDLAVLMYTSGSTGTPKGVMLTHKNLIATMQCLMFMIDNNDFVYMAYLPMAHVMELLSQLTMLLVGIKVCT